MVNYVPFHIQEWIKFVDICFDRFAVAAGQLESPFVYFVFIRKRSHIEIPAIHIAELQIEVVGGGRRGVPHEELSEARRD